MLKYSHFLAESEHGRTVFPLFGPGDSEFEKTAAASLLPDVTRYIENLRPSNESQYVLVNAMGAGEYFGSNINGDHFPEAALIHKPDEWTGNPLIDKIRAKNWAYGFPTFYLAHPYAHHRNKDSSRAFGEVELASWNNHMKRVELVVRVDHDKCQQFGGTGVWDKLKNGSYPDVSMGTKVPYDTCSICLDWDAYGKALQSYRPGEHKHPGQAVLAQHKRSNIRGLSITRKDYCDHARTQMSRIYPDGRKVWVYNDFPRFFDISFVFIGADKTAKVMVFIYRSGNIYQPKPSAEVAEDLGVKEPESGTKTASVADETLKYAFLGKLAKNKQGEIDKDVIPSQFAGKAIPIVTKREKDLPKDLLDSMSTKLPLSAILSTMTGLGMVMKPKEFQRMTLIMIGKKDLADDLESKGEVFPKVDEEESVDLDKKDFMPSLARMLLPLMAMRSAFGPVIEQRIVSLSGGSKDDEKPPTSHSSELLRKISSAYNGYRHSVMDLVAEAQPLLSKTAEAELCKMAQVEAEELFTPASVHYLKNAYMDEFGVMEPGVVKTSVQASSQRGEGLPLREHVDH